MRAYITLALSHTHSLLFTLLSVLLFAQAEMDEAMATDQPPVDVPLPDGTVLKVPFGVEDVMNPATGVHYKVGVWQCEGLNERGRERKRECVWKEEGGSHDERDEWDESPYLHPCSLSPHTKPPAPAPSLLLCA